MDWIAHREGMKERLMRIVALLLSLGILAERAGRAPLPVRVLAMGFLRRAESVARDFIGDVALPEPAGEDDDPAAAMRRAGRLRALAIALAAFAERLGGSSRAAPIGMLRAAAAANFAETGRGRLQPFDTS